MRTRRRGTCTPYSTPLLRIRPRSARGGARARHAHRRRRVPPSSWRPRCRQHEPLHPLRHDRPGPDFPKEKEVPQEDESNKSELKNWEGF